MRQTLSKQEREREAAELKALIRGIVDETIDIPDDAIVMSPEVMLKIITPKRMELIRVIEDRQPGSVSELAKLTKRHKQAVDRDLKILERNGLIELKKEGKTAMPVIRRPVVLFSLTGKSTLQVTGKKMMPAVQDG